MVDPAVVSPTVSPRCDNRHPTRAVAAATRRRYCCHQHTGVVAAVVVPTRSPPTVIRRRAAAQLHVAVLVFHVYLPPLEGMPAASRPRTAGGHYGATTHPPPRSLPPPLVDIQNQAPPHPSFAGRLTRAACPPGTRLSVPIETGRAPPPTRTAAVGGGRRRGTRSSCRPSASPWGTAAAAAVTVTLQRRWRLRPSTAVSAAAAAVAAAETEGRPTASRHADPPSQTFFAAFREATGGMCPLSATPPLPYRQSNEEAEWQGGERKEA